jgi:hypothetical protein
MLTWTPPKGTIVKIILRPKRRENGRGVRASLHEWTRKYMPATVRKRADARLQAEWDTGKREIERLSKELKAPKLGENGIKLALTDHRWPTFLEQLERACADRHVEAWICDVNEAPPDPDASDVWFDVAAFDFAPSFRRASTMRPDVHLASNDLSHVVSERFLDVVHRRGLTGLQSLPVDAARNNGSLTWFQVFATQPIGRGLDHPMLDRAAFERTSRELAGAPWLCDGWSRVWSPQEMRQDVQMGDERLIRLLRVVGERFRIFGHARFVCEFLPSTDFAYWWSSATHQECRPDFGRIRSLCCNVRARGALIAEGVAKAKDFRAMRIVSESEADVEVLDRRPLPLPPPTFTPEEAAAERARREAIKLSAPRASLRFASWLEAEQYLTMRLKDGTATWEPMSPESAKEALAEPAARACPKAWRMLLPLIPESVDELDSDGIEFECGMPHDDSWHKQNEDNDPDGPLEGDIVIAWSPNGDWFAIRPSDPAMPEEAAVTWWDHETLHAHHEWPSICAFVAELVETADRVAKA